ncbi:MAG TPA: hypothetical protein VMQ17_01645 [Candidatus Sulfotelmatobacter sp.]|nr:hypothetical protein [Candidatus Sulfotelmatobacter sp.]
MNQRRAEETPGRVRIGDAAVHQERSEYMCLATECVVGTQGGGKSFNQVRGGGLGNPLHDNLAVSVLQENVGNRRAWLGLDGRMRPSPHVHG